eukprot:1551166-Amphidinium_carterae.1
MQTRNEKKPASLPSHKTCVMLHTCFDARDLGYSLGFPWEGAIVLAAVRQNGQALEYAAPEIRADYRIVLVAVSQE